MLKLTRSQSLVMQCGACGVDNLSGARFCVNCGAGLPANCIHCQAPLPAEARFCPACGKPAASFLAPGHAPTQLLTPVAERKIVTVLFADFAGYLNYVRTRDAEEVHEQMGWTWRQLDAIVLAHGGTVEKHMGDALMAFFGDKSAREDAPAQAVRAALAMQARLTDRGSDFAGPELRLRIGIHTGRVIVESLSSAGEFSACGDAINLASRIEQQAPEDGVLISHDTYRSVYGFFDVETREPLEVKGEPNPVQTYLVSRAKPRAVARQMRGVEGVQTEMIGRQRELERLQAAFRSMLEEGEPQILTILGEPGIGKTRLAHEFMRWAELVPQRFWFFSGQATADTSASPFGLMRDVLSSRFEIQESDSATTARQKLEQGVTEMLAKCTETTAWPAKDFQMMAHFIGQLLGLDFSGSPHLRDVLGDAEQIRHRAFQYLREFFVAISRGTAPAGGAPGVRGTVLLLEDIHWSDDGSLDLLDHLARTCEGAPLLIVCLARPNLLERRPAWGEGLPAHTRLHLDALSRPESRELVESILRKATSVPQALRELVVSGGEGNPFFIEEILKMLIDQRVIVPEGDIWRIEPERLLEARVPPTLAGVLQARLDGLAPPERAVLQRASVIGRVFWDRSLQALFPGGGELPAAVPEGTLAKTEILEALDGLRRKELIFRRESSSFADCTEFVFKHELLRNVTYESVLRRLRRELHAQVAQWLIQQSGERIGESAALVARHFEQAGKLIEAAEWYGRAGYQARAGYEPATAIEYLRKALSLLPATEAERLEFQVRRVEWLEGLSDSLGAQARFGEAIEVGARMRSLAEAIGDGLAQARAWNLLAFLEERRGANRPSVAAAETAEKLAQAAGEKGRRELIRALHLKGWAFYRLAEWDAVLAIAGRTLELCSQAGDRRGLATSLKLRGVVQLQRGDYAEADDCFKQGLTICRELGDRRNAAAMLNNLGESARLRGDFTAAVESYQKALAISRQIRSRESEFIYIANLSGARLGLGEFQRVEEDLRGLLPLAAMRKSSVLSEAFSFLSEACLGQQKAAEALAAAEQALALARETGNELDLGIAWRALGRAKTLLPQPEPASATGPPGAGADCDPAACFTESLALFQKMNSEAEQARTLRAWGEFELRQGQTGAGEKKIAEARATFERLGMKVEAERAAAIVPK